MIQKIAVSVSTLVVLLVVSCGGGEEENKELPKTPTVDGKGNPDEIKLTDQWFGIATKCLVDAEEVKVEGASVISQKIRCSPMMGGKDFDEVSGKLDVWKRNNCPDKVEVRNGTVERWAGCWLTPYPAQNAIANGKLMISEKLSSAEYCEGKLGVSYGSLRCK